MFPVIIRHLGQTAYQPIYQAMQHFTDCRTADTVDELWLLEHLPVHTLGMAGKEEHLLNVQDIPIVHTDRGGQVTYHGPGQLIVYVLMDLQRRRGSIKQLVYSLEQVIIDYLARKNLQGERRNGAPGVYVAGRKIASLGLRIRRHCTYHGLSFNIDMNLSPFNDINPCGYQGLQMTQLRDLGITDNFMQVVAQLLPHLLQNLHYSTLTNDHNA